MHVHGAAINLVIQTCVQAVSCSHASIQIQSKDVYLTQQEADAVQRILVLLAPAAGSNTTKARALCLYRQGTEGKL